MYSLGSFRYLLGIGVGLISRLGGLSCVLKQLHGTVAIQEFVTIVRQVVPYLDQNVTVTVEVRCAVAN